jgi:hypothetical protein
MVPAQDRPEPDVAEAEASRGQDVERAQQHERDGGTGGGQEDPMGLAGGQRGPGQQRHAREAGGPDDAPGQGLRVEVDERQAARNAASAR